MDMSHHDDHDDDAFSVHAALAEAVVELLCVSLLPISKNKTDHHADMAMALDLIALKILQHNFKPSEVGLAIAAIGVHARHLTELFCHCAREAGIDCEVEVRTTVEKKPKETRQ
jgi:hypothetical protein